MQRFKHFSSKIKKRTNFQLKMHFQLKSSKKILYDELKMYFLFQGNDRLTKELIDRLTERKKLYVIAATHRGKLIVRFMVGSRITREEDITFAWKEITSQATEILQSLTAAAEREVHESFKNSAGDIVSRIQSLNIESKTQKIS